MRGTKMGIVYDRRFLAAQINGDTKACGRTRAGTLLKPPYFRSAAAGGMRTSL